MSPPTLSQVVYELFESDLEELRRPGAENEHTIDREVRLEFSNGDTRYISWCSEPEQYCIGVQERPFFKPSGAVAVDLSHHPLWRSFIGKVVTLNPLDAEHQVLEIRFGDAATYLFSKEGESWYSDVVTIADTKPKADGP